MAYYHFKILEKITSGILDLFNEIYIKKWKWIGGSSQWELQDHLVPIEIATKGRIIREYENIKSGTIRTGGAVKRQANIPRMALMLIDLNSKVEFKNSSLNLVKGATANELGILKYVQAPLWLQGSYELSIITRTLDEMSQIIEQILPRFNPHFPINVRIIPEIDLTVSLPITVEAAVPFEIEEDLDKESIRFIQATLQVLAPMPIFSPLTEGKIIKKIISSFGTLNADGTYALQEIFNDFAFDGGAGAVETYTSEATFEWDTDIDASGAIAEAILSETTFTINA